MISLSKAKEAIEASESKAVELGIKVSTAIVDEHGTLIAFSRMDEAITISPKFAYAKAYTSGTIGMATADMAGYAVEGKPYQGMNSLFGGELTTISGGLPVMVSGKLVGGVGVGGAADTSLDLQCALVAKAILEN